MKLSVRDATELLSQPEGTIYRWIKERALPVHRMHDRYWFNRAELLAWATAHGIRVSPAMFAEQGGAAVALPTIARALAIGGVHHDVPGSAPGEVLRAVVDLLPLPERVDRAHLAALLLAREALGATAVGGGVALPHVRSPIILHVDEPLVSLAFLEEPIDFSAPDGEPVFALFTLIAPTVREHLRLLSQLAHLLQDPRFRGAVRARADRETILELAAGLGAGRQPT